MTAIAFRNVSKTFALHAESKLLGTHFREWFGKPPKAPFHALRNVSFTVAPGESLAVVGGNGAGKSTLLSLAAGLCLPDQGTVEVSGHVAPVLELGSGFHPDLSGAENLRLNASLLGLSRRRTDEVFDKVLEFSGIGEFIHEPLRTYSAGMIMRLAFSVAINVDPDILMVDEVITVGDQGFQAKCMESMMQFRRRGKTILCVSHAVQTVRQMCDRAIWLDRGQLIMQGDLNEVLAAYQGLAARSAVEQP